MHTDLVAYVDESSARRSATRQEYMVCATLVGSAEAAAVRKHLLPLRLPGQIKLHWTDESRIRRKKITSAVADIDFMQVIISHSSGTSRKTERFRRKCFEQLYFELSNVGVTEVVVESRQEVQNKRDIAHVVALQTQGQCPDIRVRHERGGDNPLLWLPDVVLGAYNSTFLGETQYWEKLQDKVVLHRFTPDSLRE
ncbi:hypothetical protein [Corynebacterium nasicanis]|uniref:DUF3800 domain-containing protein n=1 Tax=Corynebacterium nasicanis TaxID=1448267 RepID=A0ABW1Q8S5_9CORY